jgi:dimethylglycine catabolism B
MSEIEKERIKEKESVVVEGITLTGQWNRMFEQRVIWEYDPAALEKVTSIAGAESLGWCYQCGKCTAVCPVDHVASYSPRKIFSKVRGGVDLFSDPDLWLCTTCGNCLRVCPKEVDMLKIMPAVREQVVAAGNAPPELQQAFENTFRYGNPLGEPPRRRADWAKDAGVTVPVMAQVKRPVDILFYVECYWSYHPRGKQAAQAMARTLNRLGLDFAVLGAEEKCACDAQRAAGEKGLFELFTEQNIATLGKYEYTTLMTPDPHAFNAFKNEYPKYGATLPVVHYTQLLAPRVDKLPFTRELKYKVTFHDPCYLGRQNGEYESPRHLLQAIPGLTFTEMLRCKANGYCCGGGGGGMWLGSFAASHETERLSERRVKEAVETGADVLAVCCPFEVSLFEDAVKTTGNAGKLMVRDIVELLDEACTPATQQGAVA